MVVLNSDDSTDDHSTYPFPFPPPPLCPSSRPRKAPPAKPSPEPSSPPPSSSSSKQSKAKCPVTHRLFLSLLHCCLVMTLVVLCVVHGVADLYRELIAHSFCHAQLTQPLVIRTH
ncbi:hypothetical protein E2C01_002422 [Portunus trituberculatus]|uniref:Uncharacterized protein n=1 Tax=Portunus trituberculatus TaxID=210409 RepID=A0A5B7CQP3_PORTR|nr:hypothetical protein [Portunus trituberculatus]